MSGRPAYDVDPDEIQSRLLDGETWDRLAAGIKAHPAAFSRAMQALGVYRWTPISDEELAAFLRPHLTAGPGQTWGITTVESFLRVQRMRCPREQISRVLRMINPTAVRARRQGVGVRRVFRARVNEVWSLDGYEKLRLWGIYVFAGIDAGSRYVVFWTITDNKYSISIYDAFHAAAARFGNPERVRADGMREGIMIAAHMTSQVGPGTYKSGKSTANQRIESFWAQIRKRLGWYYIDGLTTLTRADLLDPANPVHLNSIWQVVVPHIYRHLDQFIRMWNSHTVRSQRAIQQVSTRSTLSATKARTPATPASTGAVRADTGSYACGFRCKRC